MPIDDMDKVEQKEMKKIRLTKNTSCDWLINHTPDPIRESIDGVKDKIVFLRQAHLNKPCMGEENN